MPMRAAAARMAARSTLPVVPGLGARNRPCSAASPAPSNKSPAVTMAAVTVTSPLSMGAARALALSRRMVMAVMAERTIIWTTPLAQLAGGFHHLVSARDDAGVHLVGTLGGDEVGDFGDRVDVGHFQIALEQVAGALGVGHADLGGAAGRGVDEQIVAQR